MLYALQPYSRACESIAVAVIQVASFIMLICLHKLISDQYMCHQEHAGLRLPGGLGSAQVDGRCILQAIGG